VALVSRLSVRARRRPDSETYCASSRRWLRSRTLEPRVWLLAIARRVVVDRIRHDSARPQLLARRLVRPHGLAARIDPLLAQLGGEELLSILEPPGEKRWC